MKTEKPRNELNCAKTSFQCFNFDGIYSNQSFTVTGLYDTLIVLQHFNPMVSPLLFFNIQKFNSKLNLDNNKKIAFSFEKQGQRILLSMHILTQSFEEEQVRNYLWKLKGKFNLGVFFEDKNTSGERILSYRSDNTTVFSR